MLQKLMLRDITSLVIRQLVEYLKQLVSFYKYMLCEHECKNLLIKPQTILEANGVLKIYDFQLAINLEAKNDNKDIWRKYCELFNDTLDTVQKS